MDKKSGYYVTLVKAFPKIMKGEHGYSIKGANGRSYWMPFTQFEEAYFHLGASDEKFHRVISRLKEATEQILREEMSTETEKVIDRTVRHGNIIRRSK